MSVETTRAIDRLKREGCTAELSYSGSSYMELAFQICKLIGLSVNKHLRSKNKAKKLVSAYAFGMRLKYPSAPKRVPKESFYESREWRIVRYEALKLHGGACQCCGARGVDGKPLHVDHIKPRSIFPELELNVANLQVLCEDCNIGKSNTDQTDWRPRLIVNNE